MATLASAGGTTRRWEARWRKAHGLVARVIFLIEPIVEFYYRPGEWTVRYPLEHGPFAMFKDLESAKAFRWRFGVGDAIFLAEYRPSDVEKVKAMLQFTGVQKRRKRRRRRDTLVQQGTYKYTYMCVVELKSVAETTGWSAGQPSCGFCCILWQAAIRQCRELAQGRRVGNG